MLRGKLPEPEGLKFIKELLETAKVKPLNIEDGHNLDAKLKACHELYPNGCGRRMECRKLNDLLAGYLPPDTTKIDNLYRRRIDPQAWLRGTLHGAIIRERAYKGG